MPRRESASLRRRDALARRDALPAADAAAAEAIAARPFPVAVPPGAIVSGFMPMKSEINPLPLMRKLRRCRRRSSRCRWSPAAASR